MRSVQYRAAMPEPDLYSAEYWDERYRTRSALWSGQPNPQLVAGTAGLQPGTALDVGAGEGADAIWLASQGWQVLAVDISEVALARAAGHADDQDDPALAGRIHWQQGDLASFEPGGERFDLVSAQYMHPPADRRADWFGTLAAAVAAGGTLLIVGHHPADLAAGVPRPPMPELFYTGDDIAAMLDPDDWTIVTNAAPQRSAEYDGRMWTIHDAVLRAARRAAR
jgi:SAM-dependent methyltransferase